MYWIYTFCIGEYLKSEDPVMFCFFHKLTPQLINTLTNDWIPLPAFRSTCVFSCIVNPSFILSECVKKIVSLATTLLSKSNVMSVSYMEYWDKDIRVSRRRVPYARPVVYFIPIIKKLKTSTKFIIYCYKILEKNVTSTNWSDFVDPIFPVTCGYLKSARSL